MRTPGAAVWGQGTGGPERCAWHPEGWKPCRAWSGSFPGTLEGHDPAETLISDFRPHNRETIRFWFSSLPGWWPWILEPTQDTNTDPFVHQRRGGRLKVWGKRLGGSVA